MWSAVAFMPPLYNTRQREVRAARDSRGTKLDPPVVECDHETIQKTGHS